MRLNDFHNKYYHPEIRPELTDYARKSNILGWTQENTGQTNGKPIRYGFENNKGFDTREHKEQHKQAFENIEPPTGTGFKKSMPLSRLQSLRKGINLKEAEAGVKVEQEHTPNKGEALKIGLTHNLEDKNYYKKLDIMENTPLSKLQNLRKCYTAKSEGLKKGTTAYTQNPDDSITVEGHRYEYQPAGGGEMAYYHEGDEGMRSQGSFPHSKTRLSPFYKGLAEKHKDALQAHADKFMEADPQSNHYKKPILNKAIPMRGTAQNIKSATTPNQMPQQGKALRVKGIIDLNRVSTAKGNPAIESNSGSNIKFKQ